MTSSAGGGMDTEDMKALREEEDERRNFEEERFVRLVSFPSFISLIWSFFIIIICNIIYDFISP